MRILKSPPRLEAVLAVAAIFVAGAACAQTGPGDYDAQVTTTPSSIIIANTARRHIEFCNPNASIAVAVCPATSKRTGAALTCAFNGRGSITIPPSTCWGLTAQPGDLAGAWNGIAASGTANITVIEY